MSAQPFVIAGMWASLRISGLSLPAGKEKITSNGKFVILITSGNMGVEEFNGIVDEYFKINNQEVKLFQMDLFAGINLELMEKEFPFKGYPAIVFIENKKYLKENTIEGWGKVDMTTFPWKAKN